MMNKRKLLVLYIMIAVFFVVAVGGAYAWYVWSTSSDDEIQVLAGLEAATVVYTGGSNITGVRLKPTETKEEGIVKNISIYSKEEVFYTLKFNLYLDILNLPEGLKDVSFKYSFYKGDSLVKEGTFTDEHLNANLVGCTTNNTNHIVLLTDEEITSTKNKYILYIWIDGNLPNPDTMQGLDFSFKLHADGSNAVSYEPILLLNHISDLYKAGNPILITQATSNDSYYYSYQDTDSTWGLMNDGLTIDTTQDATTTGLAKVVTDTTALTSASQGNIRYFGPSNSVKNYIYFNCNDYNNQSLTDANGNKNCELWRIIGIVDGKVKIIKNDSIGNLAWDQDKNQDSSLTTCSNNWKTSSLQLFLNGLYYNRGTTETHKYYSSDTTTYTLDLTTIGITDATRTNNLISEETWYLGGSPTTSIYPNDMYNYERQNIKGTTILDGNPFTVNANIGLMYASDYGYGTNLAKCNKDMYNYYNYENSTNSYACRANNWLYNSALQWPITPDSSNSGNAWFVSSAGGVNSYHSVLNVYGVRPVLYLNSELAIESEGEGTSTNPYRISV